MSVSSPFVLNYLMPEPGAFWRWSQDIEALLYPNGATMVLYEEIEQLILATNAAGLPRFEELLLVYAATKRSWKDNGGSAQILNYASSHQTGEEFLSRVEQMGAALDQINAAVLRDGPSTEISHALLNLLFRDHSDDMDPEDAAQVATAFREGLIAVHLREEARRHQHAAPSGALTLGFMETVRNVLEVCREFDPDLIDLEMLARTGLVTAPTQADVDLPIVEQMRSLVGELLEDHHQGLAGLARIARSLSAVVQLPRPMSQPEDMPMGGYSDIANRGSLDRLLISELAQDPEVLAVRVALNEALYLRRESPPRQPSRRRAIFIDNGIRLWGLPRVFAHGLALAFGMQSEADATVKVYTHANGELIEADLASREGLLDLLSRLNPEPTPRDSVTRFLQKFHDPEGGTERIVITHPQVAAESSFLDRLLSEAPEELFLATVDREGHYALEFFSQAGHRQLQQAQLDLESLLDGSEGRKGGLGQLRHVDASLPAILQLERFPLMLAPAIPSENMAFLPDVGLVGNTNDGVLYHWPNREAGARILTNSFPTGVVSWREIDEVDRLARFLLPKSDGTAILLTVDLVEDATSMVKLQHGIAVVLHACRVEDCIVLIGERSMAVHDINSGEQYHVLYTDKVNHYFDRFVRQESEWKALALTDSGLSFQPMPEFTRIHSVELIWECPRWPAPLAMLVDLGVWCLTDPPQQIIDSPGATYSSRIGISADRKRVGVYAREHQQRRIQNYFIDLDSQTIAVDNHSTHNRLEPQGMSLVQDACNMRRYYRGIAIGRQGQLLLLSQKRSAFMLELDNRVVPHLAFVEQGVEEQVVREDWQEFERIEPPVGTRFTLLKAEWPDGSAAFLDHRGMLHLKSANPDIPQVTFVLKDAMLSGWVSDGQYFGVQYFTGSQSIPRDSSSAVFDHVLRFTHHIRRQSAT